MNNKAFERQRKRYQKYMTSRTWRKKRDELFEERGKKCEKCGSEENITVHHLTYERFGHEWLCDLMVLCEDCHKKEHERLERQEQLKQKRKARKERIKKRKEERKRTKNYTRLIRKKKK